MEIPTFAKAIAFTQDSGKRIPLVTFGHMHHQLKDTDQIRKRVVTGDRETLYFNAANVPRIEETDSGKRRSFSLVTLNQGTVESIVLIWLGEAFETLFEETIYAAS